MISNYDANGGLVSRLRDQGTTRACSLGTSGLRHWTTPISETPQRTVMSAAAAFVGPNAWSPPV